MKKVLSFLWLLIFFGLVAMRSYETAWKDYPYLLRLLLTVMGTYGAIGLTRSSFKELEK